MAAVAIETVCGEEKVWLCGCSEGGYAS